MKCTVCGRPLKNEASIALGMGPTCRKKINYTTKKNNHADFTYQLINDFLIINDLNLGNKSVTNDMEYVLKNLKSKVPDLTTKKIIYRDSMGFMNKIILDNGENPIFEPLKGIAADYMRKLC